MVGLRLVVNQIILNLSLSGRWINLWRQSTKLTQTKSFLKSPVMGPFYNTELEIGSGLIRTPL